MFQLDDLLFTESLILLMILNILLHSLKLLILLFDDETQIISL